LESRYGCPGTDARGSQQREQRITAGMARCPRRAAAPASIAFSLDRSERRGSPSSRPSCSATLRSAPKGCVRSPRVISTRAVGPFMEAELPSFEQIVAEINGTADGVL